MLKKILGILIVSILLSAGIEIKPARTSATLKPEAVVSFGGSPVGGVFVLADQTVDTIHPAAAYNSIFDHYLVAWYNDRPGYDDIYAQLLNGDGSKIGVWRSIAAGTGAERRHPDLDHNLNFNEFLVVWEQIDEATGGSSIRGQRLASTGEKTGNEIAIGSPTTVGGTASMPKVAHAFTSGSYLVVWENHTQGSLSNDIVGQIVTNDGQLTGNNFLISQGTTGFSMAVPDLAYNRRMNEFLVVWEQLDKNANLNDVYARIVRPNASMPPDKIEIARYSASSTAPTVAALPIAPTDGQYLVAFELQYAAGDRDILGRLVNGDGSLAPVTINVARSGLDESSPAAAGNERLNQYLITWGEPTAPPIVFHSIWGREFNTAGIPGDSKAWAVGLLAENPAVIAGAQGDYLVVSDDLTLTANRDIYGRLWGKRVYLPLLRRQ